MIDENGFKLLQSLFRDIPLPEGYESLDENDEIIPFPVKGYPISVVDGWVKIDMGDSWYGKAEYKLI